MGYVSRSCEVKVIQKGQGQLIFYSEMQLFEFSVVGYLIPLDLYAQIQLLVEFAIFWHEDQEIGG